MVNIPLDSKYRYIAIGVILGLFLLYLFRSCSSDILMENRYIIGQDTNWNSLQLMGKERNLYAFNNELLTTIAKQEHFRVLLTAVSNPLEELEKGELQGVLTNLQTSYLNENLFVFSDPYLLTGPVLITPSTLPVNGWNENRKKIVGVLKRSPMLLTLEQDSSIQIKIYDDILPALTDLRERRIDGAIFPAIPAYTYIQAFYKNELKITTLPLTDEGFRLVALKNEAGKSLIDKFNAGLREIKQKGDYNKMFERWGLINPENLSLNSNSNNKKE
jgi:polar amino acid transport system substrate-binding protein